MPLSAPSPRAQTATRLAAHPLQPTPLSQALRAALLGMALVAATAGPSAHAAETASLEGQAVRAYRIEAGPLGRALAVAAVTAGLALSFDPAQTEGLTSQALTGTFTAREAFARLLAGSGLEIVGRSDGSYTLRKASVATSAPRSAGTTATAPAGDTTLPVVRTTATRIHGSADTAYRARAASAGALGEKALKDTPYSVEVYSRDLLDNLQARSLADVTKADASISLASGNLLTENNSLAIRGISPDFYTGRKIDGMNARVRADDLPLEHFDRIEILKGAGGFLYGFGAPGGIVNHVLKRAGDEPVRTLSAQIMDSGLALINGDLGGRFGEGGAFGYRVNLVHESGDTYVNDGESRRNSASVALDWRLLPGLTWRVDALAGKHERDGGYWALVPNASGAAADWTAAAPLAPIDGGQRLAPSFTRYASKHETYGTDLAWQFAPDWSLQLAHRESKNGRQFLAPAIFANAQGSYAMRFWNYANLFESSQTQAVVMGRLVTGPLTHDLSFGASRTRTRSSNSQPTQSATVGSGNLANPVEIANPFSRYLSFGDVNTEYDRVRQREVFASDTLRLGTDWDLIVGLRHGSLNNQYAGYDESATTPTLAAVFRPATGLSLYASYVEALEEGATAPQTAANAGQVFSPLVSTQHEVGAKAEGRDWAASLALFRLRQGLTYTTASNVFTQDGQARYQGVELAGKFRLSPQWLLTASAMWLDATGRKTDGGALDGKRIHGVAREQASVYGEYRVAGLPLTLSAGARHIGKRPLDASNQWQVGAVSLLDAGMRLETQVASWPLTLRLNVDNLADKAYWVTQAASSYLIQGAPRTVKLGAQFDF